MVVQIELQPELEEQLAAEARARGVALESYIVQRLAGARPSAEYDGSAVGEAVSKIRTLRRGNLLDGDRLKDLVDDGRKY